MSGRIVKIATSAHQAIQELLPWFVMDKLEGKELDMVREHLAGCAQCRADADWQRKLRAAEPGMATAPDVGSAWARMQNKLDAVPAAQHEPQQDVNQDTHGTSVPASLIASVTAFVRRMMSGPGTWMPWALAAQLAVIAGLSIVVAHLHGESDAYRVVSAASFHALGTPKSAAGNLMIMFRPDATEQEIRGALQASGARIVDGPTATGAYLLDVDDTRLTSAVRALRVQRAVTLAEPLVAGAAP
jgi:hypothetical protein